jgi:hypothetical protein
MTKPYYKAIVFRTGSIHRYDQTVTKLVLVTPVSNTLVTPYTPPGLL